MAEYDKNSTPQREATPAQQTRAYAGYYGLWVGLLWVLSFGLTMYGLRSPLAGNLGLLAGICSLPVGVRLLRGFRDHIGPLPLRRAWHMAYMMFLAAALICTAAQYLYFAYLDDGYVARVYSELLQQPEVQELVSRMLRAEDSQAVVNEALTVFSSTPPSLLAMQFLFWNVLLATICAVPTALMGRERGLKSPPPTPPRGGELKS